MTIDAKGDVGSQSDPKADTTTTATADDEVVRAFLNAKPHDDPSPIKSPDTSVVNDEHGLHAPSNGDGFEQPSKLSDVPSDEGIDDSGGIPRKNRNRRKFGMGGMRPQQANAHHEPPTARLVGEYQIGNTIGRGLFGNVYVGMSVNTNSSVAIKQLDTRKTPKDYQETLKREVQTLMAMNHPNIITYKGVEIDEDVAYIIMEQLENGSVSDVIQKYGPLPEPLAAKYISQVLSALTTLHENNIVHRNLKSSNVLLKSGEVKVTDFCPGAKEEDRRYNLIGSPYWMAPEVMEMNTVSCSADIWSIGCLAIEMVTGAPPNRNLSPITAITQTLTRENPITLPDNIGSDLQDFLSHCFHKDIKKRKDAKSLRAHSWITKNENAKKDISDYPPRQATSSPQGQASPEDLKTSLSIEVLSDKDKDDIALAEFLRTPTNADGSIPPTVQESFVFNKSTSVAHVTEDVAALKKEIEALRKLNDDNVASANDMKFHIEQLVSDQYRLANLTMRQIKRVEVADEQLRGVARATAHSNMLLKRTNQLATDAVTKNNIMANNVKRLEELVLEGDSGPKKLSQFLYKKIYSDTLSNVSLAGFLSYSSNVKQWKEKRAWFVIKDNFLLMYKNEKGGSAPVEIFYLGDGARLAPLAEEQYKRKFCFKFGESLLLAADSAEQCSEWMLGLSAPQKWYESSEDSSKSRTKDETGDKDKDKEKEKENKKKTKDDKGKSGDSPAMSPRPPPHEAAPVANPIFGTSLEELFARENGNIPTFYTDMINYLHSTALHEEGILRLSGGLAEINAMRASLQRGDRIDFTQHDPHAVGGLLKCWFRELPEPLIPEPYHSESLNIMSNNEMPDDQRIVDLKVLLDQLPPENYAVLQILMHFLVQINMAADKNKMTVQNLITCMVPTLKCVPGIFMYVIPNYDFVFGGWAGEHEQQQEQEEQEASLSS